MKENLPYEKKEQINDVFSSIMNVDELINKFENYFATKRTFIMG